MALTSRTAGFVVRSARNGRGLYTLRSYRRGERITHIAGRVVPADLLWEVRGEFADNCYRFGPETYLDPGDGPGRWVNHSCEPNAAIGKARNRLFLFAARPIAAGREITIDYSTILGDDDVWTMRCNCGRPSCRERVRRFGTLPRATRDDYIRRGMVPGFILRTLASATRARVIPKERSD